MPVMVIHMLYNMMRNNHIEGAISERKTFRASNTTRERNMFIPALICNVHADRKIISREIRSDIPIATTDIKNP